MGGNTNLIAQYCQTVDHIEDVALFSERGLVMRMSHAYRLELHKVNKLTPRSEDSHYFPLEMYRREPLI